MTTGRINQVSNVARHLGGQPASRRAVPSAWTPEGAVRSTRKERTRRSTAAAPPAYRGDTSDYPIAPTKPLSTGPHAGPTRRPCGRWLAAAYGPRVEGPDPVDNADERRIPRGGFPRVTTKGRVCWPAAKSPQASALPGIQGSQGFRGYGRAPRRERTAA